jgi:aminobenzoyl-glutamate utilization protein B
MQAVSPPAIEASFRFQGQSAHAAVAPELGRSALDAVELMNVGASFLREHGPAGAGIHFAVTDPGGTAPNVVQASAGVRYTAWAADATTARALHERLEAVARGAALMTGTTVEVALEQACAAFVPSPRLEQLLMAQLQALGSLDRGAGDAAARPDPLSSAITPLASGPRPMGLPCDLGDLSQAVPTVRYVSACFDVHAEPDTWRLPVQGEPSAAHQGALHAARVLAATALDLARHPHDVQQARRELEHDLGGQHPSPVGGLLCPRR